MNVFQERISGIEISPNEKSKRIINIKIKEEILAKLIFPFHKFTIQVWNINLSPDLQLQKV